MRRTYELIARQQEEIESILKNADKSFDNLREVTGSARRYPSYILFGGPPAKSDVSGTEQQK
jgi:paraquat-inducible protein B